ncbi:MAG: ISL3 family transposase, partial [Coprothermobacterota bacterium]|nr:ISL3 family transposase [Coprothermobacterota bacterium]
QRSLEGGSLEVTVRYRTQTASCPVCGKPAVIVHATTAQRKKDRRIWDRPLTLILFKRRFHCHRCGKVFTEADPIFGHRRRSTCRLREHVARRAIEQPASQVARQEGVSASLVRRSFHDAYYRQWEDVRDHPRAAPVISLDEFSRAKRCYETLVYDPLAGNVLGLLPGNGGGPLRAYLEKLEDPDQVRVVTMDMHDPFRQAVQLCLPYARVVVDKFHFLRMAHHALGQVRVTLQQEGASPKATRLFRGRHLLLVAQERLRPGDWVKLRALFRLAPDLQTAWELKEELRQWYRSGSWEQARQKIRLWAAKVRQCGLAPFQPLLSTLREWGEEILNYFHCPFTNGPLEGKNNRTKVIKRMAYGYRNPDNLRMRILLTNKTTRAMA